MIIKVEGDKIIVQRPSDEKKHKALHGLTRTLINNMVIGVTQGYRESLGDKRCGLQSTEAG